MAKSKAVNTIKNQEEIIDAKIDKYFWVVIPILTLVYFWISNISTGFLSG